MPYYFETLQVPLEANHLWEWLDEAYAILRQDLSNLHFETEQEALDKTYRNSLDPNDLRIDSWNVVRYRQSDDQDNLHYFYGMARAALPRTGKLLKRRALTARFLEQWSILLSCHGFVTASVMARGNDVHRRRSGRAGGDAVRNWDLPEQRQWFAHYFLSAYERRGTRGTIEDRIEALVNEIVAGRYGVPPTVGLAFFDGMLGAERALKTSFRDNRLSIKKMRALVLKPTSGLPFLRKLLPLPKV